MVEGERGCRVPPPPRLSLWTSLPRGGTAPPPNLSGPAVIISVSVDSELRPQTSRLQGPDSDVTVAPEPLRPFTRKEAGSGPVSGLWRPGLFRARLLPSA